MQEIYIGTGVAGLAARPRGDASQANAPELLALRDVDAFYGKSHIVRAASLVVHENEIVALLGRNGAGKSTLLKTIIGIVPAAGGAIAWPVTTRRAPGRARSRVAASATCRRDVALFAGMSVRHNLELGRLKRQSGAGAAWCDDKILTFFPRLRTRLDTPADFLSGGEQQMVAVARALSGHVRVLLLDEPFEGLAPAVVEELFEAFDQLAPRACDRHRRAQPRPGARAGRPGVRARARQRDPRRTRRGAARRPRAAQARVVDVTRSAS